MGGWRNWYQELVNSKPLFLTIYTTVIVGIVFSSFYVFSAVYSPSSASASWFSSPPSISRMCSFFFPLGFLFVFKMDPDDFFILLHEFQVCMLYFDTF